MCCFNEISKNWIEQIWRALVSVASTNSLSNTQYLPLYKSSIKNRTNTHTHTCSCLRYKIIMRRRRHEILFFIFILFQRFRGNIVQKTDCQPALIYAHCTPSHKYMHKNWFTIIGTLSKNTLRPNERDGKSEKERMYVLSHFSQFLNFYSIFTAINRLFVVFVFLILFILSFWYRYLNHALIYLLFFFWTEFAHWKMMIDHFSCCDCFSVHSYIYFFSSSEFDKCNENIFCLTSR